MSAANERRLPKQLARLRDKDLDRVEAAINALTVSPRPSGIEQLRPNVYRLREGDWRVIYMVRDATKQVIIGGVFRRNERTYDSVDRLF